MSWRIAGMLALCLAWPSHATDWCEIELPLQKIEQGLLLIDSSTSEMSSYFAGERLRLESDRLSFSFERASLATESERLATESDSLQARGLALTSRETAYEKRGQSLDERGARIERVELMLRAAPWAAVGVFGAGVLTGVLLSR